MSQDQQIESLLVVNLPRETPATAALRAACLRDVERFFADVVRPMRERGGFPVPKTQWFFSIYREGLEATKLFERNEFGRLVAGIDAAAVEALVTKIEQSTLEQIYEYGASFVSNAMSLISNWYRDAAVLARYDEFYKDATPLEWIEMVAENEDILKGYVPQRVTAVIEKLGVIMKTVTPTRRPAAAAPSAPGR